MSDSDTRDMPFDDDSTISNAFDDVDSILSNPDGPPAQIGGYKILAKLGEGGFGVVYEAQQEEPVRRRVALKVIKPGMDSKKVIARFEAERQALALMNHPNIAKVLDGGLTDRGLPYFVMELVKGEPITEFCDRNKMELDERLRILIPVCHAVQHAHAKSVIHRDLKPGNILVGYDSEGHPQPTVIDFGVAKALNQQLTEKTIFTAEGQMIGTPEYMSPEQAEMSSVDIDTRTDVYSLGVVLYELLTGMLPFEPRELRSKMYVEMQRMIREQEPPRPSNRLNSALSHMSDRGSAVEAAKKRHLTESELPKRLRGELDWVVMKCLEKDRDRRYATPMALAEELEHYLSNEPVNARPPSASYRIGKMVRRNRVPVGVAVGFVAMLIVATGVSVRYSVIAQAERERVVVALGDREIALGEAREALGIAERRLTQIQSLVRVYSEYEERIRRIEGATSAREHLAQATIGILDELGSAMASEPWIKEELAQGYLSVGLIGAVQSDDYVETMDAFSRARVLFESLRSEDSTNQVYVLGEAQAAVGLAAAMTGHQDRHETMAIALQGEQIAQMAEVEGDDLQLKERIIARSVLAQANLEFLGQGFERAEALIERVLVSGIVSEKMVDESIKSLELRADALRIRGRIHREQGRVDEAIEEYRAVVALRERGVDLNVNDAVLRRGLVRDLYWLGRVLAYDAKTPERAVEVYQQSLGHAEHLRAADPLDGQAYELVLDQRKALATAYRRAGLIEQARVESDLLLSAAEHYASKDPLDRLRQLRVVSVRFDHARVLDRDAKRMLKNEETRDAGIGLLIEAVRVYRECSAFYKELIDHNPLGTYDKYRVDAGEVELQRGFAIEQLGKAQGDPAVQQSAGQYYLNAARYYTLHRNDAELASDQLRNLSIAYRNIGTLGLLASDGDRAVRYLELADQVLKKESWSVYARKAEAYRLVGDEEQCRRNVRLAFEHAALLSDSQRQNAEARIQGVLDQLESP